MHVRKLPSKFCLLLFFCALCQALKAQNTIESPRFFTLNFQSFSPARQLISQDGNVVNPDDDEPGYLVSSKLLFPLSLKGKTKLLGAIEYGHEVIQGLHDIVEGEDEYLRFRKLGFSIIASHKLDKKYSYLVAVKLKNGAESLFPLDGNAYSLSTSQILQKKIDKGVIGFGLQLGFNQQLTILPIVKYEKEWKNNWSIDLLLPSKVMFYKKLNETKRLYLGARGSRGTYLLNENHSLNLDPLYYRRLTANVMLGYEKQLKGPLGFMIEAGASVPLRSGLFSIQRRWEEVHAYQESVNPYVKAGIFLSIDK